MRQTFRRSNTLLLTLACICTLTDPIPAGSVTQREELDTLLARYDREPDGPGRDGLAVRIDAIAHQKYATVSRLVWHVDLVSATTAAREQGRPILHLRMLGSLEEDLSCANSRLFRATLYANQDLSRFLRDRFVLYWSSERPVPRVTIDYGDGRTLERTTTGNSAHYVLDENGQVLDVLPGLYAPAVFRRELEESLELAARVRGKSAGVRAGLIADHHRQQLAAAERDWERLAASGVPALREGLIPSRRETSLAAAQRATVTKAAVEVRDLRLFAEGLAPVGLAENQIEMWSAASRVIYGHAGRHQPGTPPGRARPPSAGVLDNASRALVSRLHNAGPPELRASGTELHEMITRLEQTILADTALNQLRLRPQISREIIRSDGAVDFQTLNAWIYAQVFRTPRGDAWLGLVQRDVFTGLPGDGVAFRGTR